MNTMFRLVIICALLLSLLCGGIVHASVAHSHGGHSHEAQESSIWAQLHSSLRHEDKKALYIIAEVVLLMLLGVVASLSVSAMRLQSGHIRASLRDVRANIALRRGVYRYRVYG